jgi:protein TonB
LPDTSISALPPQGGLAAGLAVPPPPGAVDVLPITLAISVVLHAIVLLITFAPPVFDGSRFAAHLDVVLVNSSSASKPLKAEALAQASLDGGGNTEAERRAKTSLPRLNDVDPAPKVQLASRRVRRLEDEAQRLLQLSKGDQTNADLSRLAPELPREATLPDPAVEQQRLRIAQLEAQIAKEWDEYQKLPRRKFIGARTEGVVYARYVDDWRQRIEKIGTQYFPEEARQRKLYAYLVMTVHIRADGSVEKIEIDRSSGYRLLDTAARRAVDLAGPFPPFPPEVRKDWDILSISRTFSYTRTDLEVLANP